MPKNKGFALDRMREKWYTCCVLSKYTCTLEVDERWRDHRDLL